MVSRVLASAFLGSAALIAGCSSALAQGALPIGPDFASTTDADLPVMSRPRPEYDAKGIPLGGFRLFPTVDITGSYDDNVFRRNTSVADDYFVDVAPAFRLQSQWSEHLLEVYAGASNYNYTNNTQLDLTDWNGGVDGRYDIMRGMSVSAVASDSELHEPLSSANTLGTQSAPNVYNQYHSEVGFTAQPNRLGFAAGGVFDHYQYQSAPLFGGGVINNSDRNFDEYQGNAKVFYDFSPGYQGVVRATYDTRQYSLPLDRFGLHRSSNGYRIDGGLELQLTHLLSGEIYLGYLDQKFTAPLQDVRGLDYSVKVDWLATPLLTVHVAGARTLTPTTLPGASVEDDQSIGISADYELLRNVIVQAHANYIDSTYEGIARHDNLPDLGVGVKYLANRYMSFDLSYSHNSRETNIVGLPYQDNLIAVGLNLHI